MTKLLDGLRILVLEDEFLIAMDVEQLCRDHGADDVVIARSVSEVDLEGGNFDAAVVDIMLGGQSTLAFARTMQARDIPFVFASGYADLDELSKNFPNVPVVGKPYAGDDLVEALAAACGRL